MARNVLVDTSAIYAFVSSGDRFHTQSREIYSELLDRGDLLYTHEVPGRQPVELGRLVGGG